MNMAGNTLPKFKWMSDIRGREKRWCEGKKNRCSRDYTGRLLRTRVRWIEADVLTGTWRRMEQTRPLVHTQKGGLGHSATQGPMGAYQPLDEFRPNLTGKSWNEEGMRVTDSANYIRHDTVTEWGGLWRASVTPGGRRQRWRKVILQKSQRHLSISCSDCSGGSVFTNESD